LLEASNYLNMTWMVKFKKKKKKNYLECLDLFYLERLLII